MRKTFLIVATIASGILCSAQTTLLPGFPPGTFQNRAAHNAAAVGVTCSSSQGNAFLARTSGLSDTDKTNYCTLIDGLETDAVGCSNTLDVLYILAAPDSTTMLLNLCSSNFDLTSNGTGTFTANQGYASNGTTGYLDTNFTPATNSAFSTQNSASLGVYIRTNRTSSSGNTNLGGIGANGAYTYFRPVQTAAAPTSINSSNFPNYANTQAQGAYTSTRTGASTIAAYKNGSSTTLTLGGASAASTAFTNGKLFINALNNNGPAIQWSTDQQAAVWYGAGMSGANAVLIHTRINTFLTAYGTNVY